MNLMLFWHASGVINYHDRFSSLANVFEKLTVIVPKNYKETKGIPCSKVYTTKVLSTSFNNHPSTILYHKLNELNWKEVDIVWIHEEAYSLSSLQISSHCRKRKIPYVLESAVINMRFSFYGMNILEKTVMNNSAYVCFRNQQVKSFLLKRGLKKNKLGIEIANGVTASKNDFAKIKDKKEQNDNKYRIGFVGRIFKAKGVLVLANALSKMDKEIEFLLAGEEEEVGVLEEIFKIYSKTIYLGKLNFEELNSIYQSIDVLVLPSIPTKKWTEQFGRVLSEGIVQGTYACGSKIGAIPKIVGRKNTFEPNNVESLKNFLENILTDNSYRNRRKKQYNNILKNYTWDSQSVLIKSLCMKITNGQ